MKETDCSSILTEDDNQPHIASSPIVASGPGLFENAINNNHLNNTNVQANTGVSNAKTTAEIFNTKLNNQLKTKMKTQVESQYQHGVGSNKLTWSAIYRLQGRHEFINMHNYIKSQHDATSRMIAELNAQISALREHTQRFYKLEEQLRADEDLIRKTEQSLKFYINTSIGDHQLSAETRISNETFKVQLRKQLDYLKYRRKLTVQDLNVERVRAEEGREAIKDHEVRLAHLNYYLKDLKKYAMYIESQLQQLNQDANSKKASNFTQQQQHLFTSNSNNNLNSKAKKLPPLLQQQVYSQTHQNFNYNHSYNQFFPNSNKLNSVNNGGSTNKGSQGAQNYQSGSYLNTKYAQYNI